MKSSISGRESMDRSNPILYIIIPCYNEEEVLPATAPLFLKKIEYLIASGKISNDSKILFVMMVLRIVLGILLANYLKAILIIWG